MTNMIRRYIRLMLGLFLCSIGIVMTINADLGYSPWDVLHKGSSNILNTTMGNANIMVGIIVLVIARGLGEKTGVGTICNMIFIGIFMNIIMSSNIMPRFDSFIPSVIMIIIGMFILSIGMYFYIGSELGAGPRDSLMIAFIRRTNKPVRFVKNSLEITVLLVGYLLGGPVGIGTVIMSLGMGYVVQFVFNILKFDTTQVKHRLLDEDIRDLKKFTLNMVSKKS